MFPRQCLIAAATFIPLTATPAQPQEVQLVSSSQPFRLDGKARVEAQLAQPARLMVRNVSLATALVDLRHSSGVPIAFSPSILPALSVSCFCEELTVGEALDYLLAKTSFRYVVVNHQILIERRPRPNSSDLERSLARFTPAVALSGESGISAARPVRSELQEGTITGRVMDAQTAQPLASVQVYIAGADIGVLTPQNGRYLLQNVPAGTHTITAQRIGYRTETQEVIVRVGATIVQDFQIAEEALQLDEVIVTGTPGGTQRRAIGNTVTRLEAAEITERVAITNMQDMLAARSPGLRFERLSGNVGTGSAIQIRGVSSFNLSAQPLIVVDGVRVNNSTRAGPTLGTSGGTFEGESGSGEVSVLDDFNPEDIESIEIIKGPAAATLYGTEASAGVIQIITKKGLEGEPQFTLSVRQGTNFMMDPAGKLGTQYGCNFPTGTPEKPTQFSPCPAGETFDYNMYEEANRYIQEGYFPWPTENLYQYGHSQSYNLDVRGGSPTVRYFLSGNYEDDEGVVWYNTDEALRLRANVGVVLSENWSLDVSTGYVDGETRFLGPTIFDGGIWQDMRWADGSCLERVNPGACPLGGFQEHLPSEVAQIVATREYSRFTGSATLNHTLGDWFTQRVALGIDKGWDTNTNLFPRGVENYTETVEGQVNLTKPVTTNMTVDYAATARWRPNPAWSFATSAGVQYYIEQFENLENIGRGFASSTASTVDQTELSQLTLDFDFIENKSLGVFVQEEVGWNDRLFLTGALRFDDNSAFGADFDVQVYPKVQATWAVSEERFWNLELLNQLRLRAAWGQAGRQPDVFAAQNIYQVIPGPGGTAGIASLSPGNAEVGPEVGTEIEAGFDFALLNDRVSGEFTYFHQRNEDALLEVGISPSLGFTGSVDQNLGRLDNWGWEASLHTRLYESPDFSFDLALTGTYVMNEIKALGNFAGTNQIRIGVPYPNITVGWRVVSAEADPNADLADATGTDANGTPIVALCDAGISLAPEGANPDQYGILLDGTPIPCNDVPDQDLMVGPAFAPYSWTVAPTIRLLNNRLQLFALAEGQYGRTSFESAMLWGHNYHNTSYGADLTDPVYVASDELMGTVNSLEKNVFDADFWKLREVGFRYTLPPSLLGRFGAQRATLSLSARNIWTIWQRTEEVNGGKISDPEYGAPGGFGTTGSFWQQPPLSSVHATLRISFGPGGDGELAASQR